VSVLSTEILEKVEEQLVASGLLTRAELAGIKDAAKADKKPFVAALLGDGRVSNEDLTKSIAVVTNLPYVNLSKVQIEPSVLDLLPQDTAQRYMAVPLGEMHNRLVVAMLDADNVQAVDFLSNKIGRPLKVYAASEEGIRNVLKQYKTEISDSVVDDISKLTGDSVEGVVDDSEKLENARRAGTGAKEIQTLVQDSPVSKALNTILDYAAKNRASDVHIEPTPNSLVIRCRIDGILREIMKLPKASEPPLVSRIKILSNLKIDEHRIPQDGEFTVSVAGRDIDLRIAISPVVWGEQVVIRLLDKSSTSLKLEDMGYRGRALRTIRDGLKQSNGLILTSGPTGSGKSTSLYALLSEIKDDSINIVTLEDPVEYKMQGVNQIQVNADVGLNFGTGLRSILRQDPDVVMVGEIRDRETAELAVQAALTGHLVFSTLHTNSAAGILPRLLDMGIEPFLIASTVKTVIGQRLVRRLADEGEAYQSDPAETEAIKAALGTLLPKDEASRHAASEDLGYESLPLGTDTAYTLHKGIDSPIAPGGYQGRMGIYEVFGITEEIQQLILNRATSTDIQKMAIEQGMVTMRQDGYLKALAGMTSLNEINRVASASNT
jgi:type IV pilus assembly protein PilB